MNNGQVKLMDKGQVIKTTNGLKPGDWVYLVQNPYFYKGYVTEILGQNIFKMYCIGYHKDGKYIEEYKEYGKISTNTSSYIVYKEMAEFTFNDLEYKSHLYNLALDTNDNEWLRELAN